MDPRTPPTDIAPSNPHAAEMDFILPGMDQSAGAPDFVLPPVAAEVKHQRPPGRSRLQELEARGGILGSLATAAILILKFIGPLLKAVPFLPKLAVTGGSMLLAIWAEASLFGWTLAVAIVGLMFVHESGHAVASWQRKIPVSAMIFIPFFGAMVVRTRWGKDVAEDAYIGIMGPVFGAVGGFFCLCIGLLIGDRFWLVAAQFAMMLNLFNLLPTPPLDGGRIVAVFSPKLLAAGMILLLFVAPANPFLWLLVFLSIPRVIAHWKAKPEDPYFRVTSGQRWRFGLAYLGLVGLLAWSGTAIHRALPPRRIGTVDLAQQRRTENAQVAADQDSR